jgi:hypothetical protein
MAGRFVRSSRAAGAGALILVLAVGLAACGSSAKTSSTQAAATISTTSTSSTTTSTAAHKPHKAVKKKTVTKHTTTTTKSTTSKSKTTTTTSTTTHTTTTHTTTTSAKPTYTPPMQVTLVGMNHHPTIKLAWYYTVTATDSKGAGLPGTVLTQFTFNGTVVGKENPPTHKLVDGKLHNKIEFPAESLGEPISLQVTVTTPLGTKTLSWPVKSVK